MKTVFVGMSGGVDSSVSAAMLKEQGYNVVGVFIRTWHPDFIKCTEEEERRDAMRVCAHLDIPFLTFDFEEVYKKQVADYMIAEYKAGRTPNPDVMCNKHVKFGAFLKKALSMGADYVATGHYAINAKKNSKKLLSHFAQVKIESSFLNGLAGVGTRRSEDLKKRSFQFLVNKGVDPSKDQSYFLWTLGQKQLSKILFPVGYLNKTEVRKLAKKFKIPVAEKKDSQGICFLGAVDLKDFLKHYIKEKRGNVINQDGEIIGYHNGAVFHTLGERHGFTITEKSPNDGAYYVVDKDVKKNILYVSKDKIFLRSQNSKKLLSHDPHSNLDAVNQRNIAYVTESTSLNFVNWISEIPKINKKYTCQIRYHGEFLSCKIVCESKAFAKVIFEKQTRVASGQSCVFYDKNTCLGGGVVV